MSKNNIFSKSMTFWKRTKSEATQNWTNDENNKQDCTSWRDGKCYVQKTINLRALHLDEIMHTLWAKSP